MLTAAEIEALLLSLRVAGAAVVIGLPFALCAGLALAHPRLPGKTLLSGLIYLPLILPPVVIGYLLLITLGTRAPLGAFLEQTFGLRLIFDWKGAALAAALVAFPFQARAIRLAAEAIDPGLYQAAASLGAGPLDRLLTVTLPLASPGLLAGAITAWAAALGEFGAIITFVSNVPGETRTLPLAIYSAIQSPGGEAAAARLVALSVALALAGLFASELAGRALMRVTGRR